MLYLIYQKRIWSYCLEHINADIFTPLPLKSCLPHQQKKKAVRELQVSWIWELKFLCSALTQEDTLSLWFKVLPMKRGCKGQAPSFWHHYFLACPEQNVLHVLELVSNGLDAAGAGKWGGRLQGPPLRAGPQRMPGFFSHILQSQWKHWKTTRSHQLSSVTRRPQEKSMSKYQRRGRGVGGGSSGALTQNLSNLQMWQQQLLPATCASFRLNPSLGFKSSFILIF